MNSAAVGLLTTSDNRRVSPPPQAGAASVASRRVEMRSFTRDPWGDFKDIVYLVRSTRLRNVAAGQHAGFYGALEDTTCFA